MVHSRTSGRVAAAAGMVVVAAFALSGCSSAAAGSDAAGSTHHYNYIGPGADSAAAAATIAAAGRTSDTSWCGKKEITVGVEDGVGLNGWSANSYATVRSELAKCANVKQIVSAGQGDPSKAIANTQADVAQGVNAIVVIPDFGPAQLPSLRAATKAGVKVVPWAATTGGVVGKDYVDTVQWNARSAGLVWTEWMAKQLGNKGKLVFIGGPAGNTSSTAILGGVVAVTKQHPGLEVLTGDSTFPAGNWDQSKAQSVMAALIAKYPEIDGVMTDDSASAVGVMAAFTAAGRKLPLIASNESNQLACAYKTAKASHPELQLATISARNWMGRIAARKAVAAAEGLPETSPSLFNLPLYEDSTGGRAPQCDPKLSPSTLFSSDVSTAELAKYGNSRSN